MGKKSLICQISEELKSRYTAGNTKYNGDFGIDTTSTLRNYIKSCTQFGGWCRANYGAKTIDECRQYIEKYFNERENLAPDTRKKDASALRKLYKTKDIGRIDTGSRSRENRTNNRGEKVRDKHFSESGKYANFVTWEKGTGTRAYKETAEIKGSDIYTKNGDVFVHVEHGKGDRQREVPVLPQYKDFVLKIKDLAGDNKILPYLTSGRNKVPEGSNAHQYRHEYAQALYDMHKRPYEQIPRGEKYICRKDRAGVVLDRAALKIVTEALGHDRENEPPESYLT